LRSLDLDLGRIDLELTPQELARHFAETSGTQSIEFLDRHRHKSLWVSGIFIGVYRDHPGFYDVHLQCGGILVFVRMNQTDSHGHLKVLNKGDTIKLRGRISHIAPNNLMLEDGQFAESRRLVSEEYESKPQAT
jgi:hypothetical protein